MPSAQLPHVPVLECGAHAGDAVQYLSNWSASRRRFRALLTASMASALCPPKSPVDFSNSAFAASSAAIASRIFGWFSALALLCPAGGVALARAGAAKTNGEAPDRISAADKLARALL